jgi:predicted permease
MAVVIPALLPVFLLIVLGFILKAQSDVVDDPRGHYDARFYRPR